MIEISRCAIPTTAHEKQLHVVCDASEKAYAAVVYLRTETTDCEVQVWLLTSENTSSTGKAVINTTP